MKNEETLLSVEEATQLLFSEKNNILEEEVFDSYGNYNFTTDIHMQEPNGVCSIIDGFLIKK
jgi:hypothetical protein